MIDDLLDQFMHFIVAMAVANLVGENLLHGAAVGLSLGLVREFTEWQHHPDRGATPFTGPGALTSPGSLTDLFFWTLGGLVGAII